MYDVKTFTVEEADLLIPTLTPLLNAVESIHLKLQKLQAQTDALELVTDDRETEPSPNMDEVEQLVAEMKGLAEKYQDYVDKIQSYGCYLKGVFPTLIDFFHTNSGNVVYLCWMLGEPKVKHWHDVGKGFTDRHKIGEFEADLN
ncbi:MAG: DUF2203 family protein [Candidatus Omnitrophica bacterium]|nr:DUF2203 family protein [Candidatus Omnitrophota bacterium]